MSNTTLEIGSFISSFAIGTGLYYMFEHQYWGIFVFCVGLGAFIELRIIQERNRNNRAL